MVADDKAADGGGNDAPCMMDDRDGTGDGDGGKEMWVIGTPIDGGRGGSDTGATAEVADGIAAAEMEVLDCWACGAGRNPDTGVPENGSSGMPP
jgi:hypothetical protein